MILRIGVQGEQIEGNTELGGMELRRVCCYIKIAMYLSGGYRTTFGRVVRVCVCCMNSISE